MSKQHTSRIIAPAGYKRIHQEALFGIRLPTVSPYRCSEKHYPCPVTFHHTRRIGGPARNSVDGTDIINLQQCHQFIERQLYQHHHCQRKQHHPHHTRRFFTRTPAPKQYQQSQHENINKQGARIDHTERSRQIHDQHRTEPVRHTLLRPQISSRNHSPHQIMAEVVALCQLSHHIIGAAG